jgi:hypothetical protein
MDTYQTGASLYNSKTKTCMKSILSIFEEGDAAEAPPQVLWGNEKMKLENNGI